MGDIKFKCKVSPQLVTLFRDLIGFTGLHTTTEIVFFFMIDQESNSRYSGVKFIDSFRSFDQADRYLKFAF